MDPILKSPVLVASSFFLGVKNSCSPQKIHLAIACLRDLVLNCKTHYWYIDIFSPQSLICCSYLSWSACRRRCLWASWLSPLWRAASWTDWLDSAPAYGSRKYERLSWKSIQWLEWSKEKRVLNRFKVFWQSWHHVYSQLGRRSERYWHVLLIHMWMLTVAFTQTHVDSLQAVTLWFARFLFIPLWQSWILISLCFCSEWMKGCLD